MDVVDQEGPAFRDGGANDPLPQSQPEMTLHVLGIADCIGDSQLVALLVEQPHGKGLERRQSRNQLRDLLEKLVEIEDRRDFASQLEQGDEKFSGLAHRWSGGRRSIRRSLGHSDGRPPGGGSSGLYW